MVFVQDLTLLLLIGILTVRLQAAGALFYICIFLVSGSSRG